MAGIRTFTCFVALLIILPTFGRNIRQSNGEGDDAIVGINVKQTLPEGMDIKDYNSFILNYWTPERMASAKPMKLPMIANSSNLNVANRVPLTSGNKRAPVQINIPGVHPKSLKASPSVVCKMYMTVGTGNYLCSASVIVSENGDTAFTAGHCVYDTDSGTWASNIILVPAYESGSSPYGRWAFRDAATFRGWTQNADFNYDVAVVLLATSDEGEHIQDVTGSLGMTVNKERQAPTVSYGYPVNIHRGEILASCTDDASEANIPQFPTYEGMRLPCNMTGGSSGGPWTQDGTYQTSVNSFGIIGQDDVMYGPYFGDPVLSLWEQFEKQ